MNQNMSGLNCTTLIIDKIDSIDFSPPVRSHIVMGTLMVITGLLLVLIISKTFGIILTGAGLFFYSVAIFKSRLTIHISKGHYFMEKGFLRRRKTSGNISEFDRIEVKVIHAGEDDFRWWAILKWKNGKEFALGVYPCGGDAKILARELCDRLAIEFVDNSLKLD